MRVGPRLRWVLALALVASMAGPGLSRAATHATITVDETHDELNSDGDCSLREAVEAANTDAAVDNCTAGSGADTIVFSSGTNGNDFNLTLGPLSLTDDVTIDGNGTNNTVVTGDDFEVTAGVSATIQDMTLVLVDNEGGTATIDNIVATDEMNNNSTGTATSTMTISNSTLSDVNNNSGFGTSVTTLTITDSTAGDITNNSGFGTTTHMTLDGVTSGLIDNNSGFNGSVTTADISNSDTGEIDNNASSDSTTTSTITDTSVTGSGNSDGIDVSGLTTSVTITGSTITNFDEGIFSDGVTTLVNSTVSGNVSESIAVGGGTFDITNSTITDAGETGIDNFGEGDSVTLTNTIISNHPEEGNCSGQVNSGGGNISDDGTCNLNGLGDQENTDPQIGPLANNGGPTQTHLPQTGSPAIDMGLDGPCPGTDQRGDPRPADGDGNGTAICDVGSVEVQGPATGADIKVTKTDSPDPVLVGDVLTYTITVKNNGPEDAQDVVLTDSLPSTVTFSSASSTQGTCDQANGTVTCDIGTIANGDTVTVTITVTADQEGTITNSAAGSSSTEDPVPGNNTDSETTTVNPVPGGGVATGAGGTSGSGRTPLAVVGALLALTAAGAVMLRRILGAPATQR